MGVTVEECESLRDAAETSGLIVQVGTEKRFDEGIAFARDFIREEMGEILALKAWYCDSTHRYTITDALQPVIEASESARRPEGDPRRTSDAVRARARESPTRHARFLGGGEVHPHRLAEEVRGVLLVLGGRIYRRERQSAGPDAEDSNGLARGLPGSTENTEA